MANYKLITSEPTGVTSQLVFQAGATNTVVASVTAHATATSDVLEVLIKKNGGSAIEIAKKTAASATSPEEMLTAPVALEALDELFVRTSRTGAKFVVTYVEETATPNDTALGGLVDVDTTGVADGQSLVYNSTNSQWEPATVSGGGGGGSTTLAGLDDTSITSPVSGNLLRWNGSDWANATANTSIIVEGTNLYYTDARVDTRIAADTTKADANHTHLHSDITDFDTEVNALITAANLAAASHTHLLSDITDSGTAAALNVPAAGDAAAGEVVKGDDTRLTDARTPTSHTHLAADITDFDTEVSNNTTVVNNSGVALAALGAANTASQDLNSHLSSIENHSDVTFAYTSINRPNNAFLVWSTANTRWEDDTISIDKCSDVDTTTAAPTTGDVLEWDGTNFVPATPSGGGATTLNALTDTNIALAADTEVLKYDGSEWINDNILKSDVQGLTTDLTNLTTDIDEAANFESATGAAGLVGNGGQFFKNFDSGASLTAGKVYYLHATTGWEEADASAEATATNLLAMCTSTSTNGTSMLQCGVINAFGTQSGITQGAPIYLSETSGEITHTAPTTSGAIARVIGYKVSDTDDTIFFNPSNDWIEIS